MRWPWTVGGPTEDDMRRAEHALGVLTERVSDLQSDMKRIRAEWEDMFERLVRRDDRLRKRQERSEAADPTPDSTAERKRLLRLRLRSNGSRQ